MLGFLLLKRIWIDRVHLAWDSIINKLYYILIFKFVYFEGTHLYLVQTYIIIVGKRRKYIPLWMS